MADLLFKKLIIILCAMVFICHGANAYETSFPFPFEFGHSSDIYLETRKIETKETRQKSQIAQDLLIDKGIKKTPEAFVKYIKKNDYRAVKLLLDAGFDPNTCVYANYLIYYAAKYNRNQILYLLLENGADPNKDLNSPLRIAIKRKDYACAKMLIDYGANVNYRDGFSNETLTLTALKKKQYAIFHLLVKNGAKLDDATYYYIKKKKLEDKIGFYLD